MLTTFAGLAMALFPIATAVALLELAAWRERRREAAVARQIALTDAIGGELGAVVAPVVTKPMWGPWQIRIAVPFARPVMVARVLTIAHRFLGRTEWGQAGRYRIILTPQEEASRRQGRGPVVAPRAKAA